MDWKLRALSAALLYGIWGYLGYKSSAIYGPRVACFLQMCGYAVFLAATGFGRADLARLTWPTFGFGVVATACAVIGTYLIFSGVEMAPKEHQALVYIISDAYPLIVALLTHFLIRPLHWRAWLGALLISGGMALVWGAPRS